MTRSSYRPIDARVYPRFAGVRTFMRLPHVTDTVDFGAAAVGIPFDTATSFRPGARFGPEGIRSASVLLRPYHPALEIDVLDALTVVDYGDLPVAPGDTEGTYRRIEDGLAPLVEAGVFPLVLGGDHSITLPELRALARRHGQMALVQLDSHTDTWDEYFDQKYFHGTTFKRAAEEGLLEPAASVQAGMRGSLFAASDLKDARALGFTVIPSEELRALGPQGYARTVRERVGDRPVFLSFDIDFLDPAFAPGTGTPEVAGFSTAEALAFVRALAGIRLVGCDIVEVAPPYDGPGQATALAAANIALDLLALYAISRGAKSGLGSSLLVVQAREEDGQCVRRQYCWRFRWRSPAPQRPVRHRARRRSRSARTRRSRRWSSRRRAARSAGSTSTWPARSRRRGVRRRSR